MNFLLGQTLTIPRQLCNGVTRDSFKGGWSELMACFLGHSGTVTEYTDSSYPYVRIRINGDNGWVFDKRLFLTDYVEETPQQRICSKIKRMDLEWTQKQLNKKVCHA